LPGHPATRRGEPGAGAGVRATEAECQHGRARRRPTDDEGKAPTRDHSSRKGRVPRDDEGGFPPAPRRAGRGLRYFSRRGKGGIRRLCGVCAGLALAAIPGEA